MERKGSWVDIEISRPEIVYLSLLNGSRDLMGIEDPFVGMEKDEIAGELARARDALLKKGMIIIAENNAVIAEDDLKMAISVLNRPACIVVVQRHLSNIDSTRLFHVSKYFSVWHLHQQSATTISLHLTENIGEVARAIVEAMGLPKESVPFQGEEFDCDVEEITRLISGEQPSDGSVLFSHPDFSKSLDSNTAATALSFVGARSRGGSEKTVSFVFNAGSFWEIKPVSDGGGLRLRIKPSDPETAKKAARRMAWDYLPELAMRMV